MELRDYLYILRRRWVSVLTVTLAVWLAAAAITFSMTKQYTATTRLFFAVSGTETVTELAQGSTFAEKQITSYVQVATSPLCWTRSFAISAWRAPPPTWPSRCQQRSRRTP